MTTAAYINQFLSTHKAGLPKESVLRWCHRHPTLNKVIEVATFILGSSLLAAGVSLGSWTLGLVGGALAVAAAVAFLALKVIAPSHHDMKTKVFSPAKCQGGELYYEGDLPILKIDGRNPKIAGFAQGYLLGDSICQIVKRFDTALHTVLKRPRAHELTDFLAKVREQIPQAYLSEMEGLVSGYNQWVKEQSWPRPKQMTLDEAILFHMMPDMHNLSLGGVTRSPLLRTDPVMGCSSIVDRDPEKGIVFGRNMDWPSLDITGKYSLIKHIVRDDLQTVEVTIPGMVGTLTGMNQHGLSLAMNVCMGDASKEPKGMPALFYNRFCLESCRTVADMNHMPRSNLGPYHLTVADPENASSFHILQGLDRRRLEENGPLATFNRSFGDASSAIDLHYTSLRKRMLEEFYQGATPEMDREELMEAAVRLPCINNYETTHTVIMEPATRRMKVALDNAFSANSPLREVPLAKLFGNQVQAPAQELAHA